jgi:hypothetical protein
MLDDPRTILSWTSSQPKNSVLQCFGEICVIAQRVGYFIFNFNHLKLYTIFYWNLELFSQCGIFVFHLYTCGIMVIRDLRSCSPIIDISTPSICILPFAASIILNNARVKDDFPAPVLPTIPICK